MNRREWEDTASGVRYELADVEGVIENEIRQGATQRQVAQSYALGIRSNWPTDWKRVNAAIVDRWPKGLERIKRMAWDGSCFDAPETRTRTRD